MLEMSIRTGRRVHDAVRRLQEKFDRDADERQQVNSLHRQRMSCSDSLRSFTNTQDWTLGLGMSPSGRFRVVEEARPKQKIISREGIRWDAAWIAIIAVIVLCCTVLLSDVAGMGLSSRSIRRLDVKIEDMAERTESLRHQVALNASDVSVCTEAVKLNLISGYGAQTIQLTAPQELSTGAVTADSRGATAGWMTGDAQP